MVHERIYNDIHILKVINRNLKKRRGGGITDLRLILLNKIPILSVLMTKYVSITSTSFDNHKSITLQTALMAAKHFYLYEKQLKSHIDITKTQFETKI